MKYHLFFLTVLGLLCGYLWLWDLSGHYFTQDNAHHLIVGWNILNTVMGDGHPPLYYGFLKVVMSIFGVNSPLILRSVSLISGFCAVTATFFLGTKISKSKFTGFTAAFLLATSPLFSVQSQIVRQYSLLVFLVILSLIIFQQESFSFRTQSKAAVVIFLATCTHYSSLFFVPSLFVLGIRKVVKDTGNVTSKVYLILLWLLICFGITCFSILMLKSIGWGLEKSLISYGDHFSHLASELDGNFSNLAPTLLNFLKSSFGSNTVWIILVLSGVGVFGLFKNKETDHLILFFGPLLTGLYLSLSDKYPLTSGRHSIYLIPVVLIPLIGSLKWTTEKSRFAVAAIFLLIFTTQFFEPNNRYNIVKSRILYQQDLGPKFTEMRILSAFLKNLPPESTIMVDGYLETSVLAEAELKPKWAIFSDLKNPILTCSFWPGYVQVSPCLCFNKKNGEIVKYLSQKWSETGLLQLQRKEPCFRILNKVPINQKWNLISLSIE